jgi:hypothetical protein
MQLVLPRVQLAPGEEPACRSGWFFTRSDVEQLKVGQSNYSLGPSDLLFPFPVRTHSFVLPFLFSPSLQISTDSQGSVPAASSQDGDPRRAVGRERHRRCSLEGPPGERNAAEALARLRARRAAPDLRGELRGGELLLAGEDTAELLPVDTASSKGGSNKMLWVADDGLDFFSYFF